MNPRRVSSHLSNLLKNPMKKENAMRTIRPGTALVGATFAVALAGLVLAPTPSANAAPPVEEIVKKANNAMYYAGDDVRSQTRMTIHDARGRKRIRQFTILRLDEKDGGDQHFLVYFTRPADVRKTVFLVDKHVDSDDDRWLYLPALDLVKRIAAGDKRTSFVGTHFFYEDISGRDLRADEHELVEETDSQYILKGTPKDSGSVEFDYYKVWIDKDTMVPRKMDYFDGSDEPYRRLENVKIETIDGHPTATVMKASDLRSGAYTVSQMRGVQYDTGLPERIFAERSLRNPPRKYLR
ncbi:MAG: outer membrane lipoprotein-sorting protein [Myxococcota bacterium]